MSRRIDSSTTHEWPKSWSSVEDPFGEFGRRFSLLWKVFVTELRDSSHKEMIQVLLSLYGHKLSATTIGETVWESHCSNLLHFGADSVLILLLLIFVFLAFLMMRRCKPSLMPAIWHRIARPICDGRLFATSLFRRLTGQGPYIFRSRLFNCLLYKTQRVALWKVSLCTTLVVPILYRFLVCAWPIRIGAGAVHQRYLYIWFVTNITDQVHDMLTTRGA